MTPTRTRRSFIVGTVSSAVSVPSILASRIDPVRAGAAPAAEEANWQRVREQFAFDEAKVPMNAANLCPSPRAIADRVTHWTRDIDADCSFENRAKFHNLLETSRTQVARQLGVSPDEIALVRNTSEANNTINNGLKLRSGDEIVLWDQNHPTNNVAWDVRAARFGLTIKRIATPAVPASVDELVATFANAFGPKTRVLAITHVSNVTGLRLPVRELCDAAHRRDIYVHVDGAQTWGALDVSLPALGCDSYAASSHKWFAGPKEVGLLYVRSDRVAQIWPNVVAPGWGSGVEPDVRGARRFESMGQRDDAALAAIADTVEFHRSIGAHRIEQRIYALADQLKSELQESGFDLVTPMDRTLSAGVCVLRVAGDRRGKLSDRLYQEHGIAGAPTGGLRLCPHVYNTREHVDRAVRAIRGMRELVG